MFVKCLVYGNWLYLGKVSILFPQNSAMMIYILVILICFHVRISYCLNPIENIFAFSDDESSKCLS